MGWLEPELRSTQVVGQNEEHVRLWRGRDVTFRNIVHYRGMSTDKHDDGGKSPFPQLSKLEAGELEYALRYRDRFLHKAKYQRPIAVLKEFCEEQEKDFEGVFSQNSLSQL